MAHKTQSRINYKICLHIWYSGPWARIKLHLFSLEICKKTHSIRYQLTQSSPFLTYYLKHFNRLYKMICPKKSYQLLIKHHKLRPLLYDWHDCTDLLQRRAPFHSTGIWLYCGGRLLWIGGGWESLWAQAVGPPAILKYPLTHTYHLLLPNLGNNIKQQTPFKHTLYYQNKLSCTELWRGKTVIYFVICKLSTIKSSPVHDQFAMLVTPDSFHLYPKCKISKQTSYQTA